FKDTPPLKTYTLSLHDALPISPRLSDQCPEGLASQNALSNAGELGVRQSQETRKNPILGTTTSSSRHPPRGAKVGYHKADWIRLDRKSTRLNSSHVSISYAVFC